MQIPNWYGARIAFGYEPVQGLWDPGRRPRHFNVAGGSQAQIKYLEDEASIALRGVIIDSVNDIACEPVCGPGWDHHPRSLQHFATHIRTHLRGSDRIMQDRRSYPTGEPLDDVQWRTLICNITYNDHTPAPESYRSSYQAWRDTLDPAQPYNSSRQQGAQPFCRVIGGYNADKLFGSTKEGYVGMFPSRTKVNDCIVVLFGGEFPFVMRKCINHGKETYQLIGQCYVHGIMEKGRVDISKYTAQEFVLDGAYEA